MKTRKKKEPNDYPRVTLRVELDLLRRIDGLRRISGLSYGQIFGMAVRRHLPELEKFHAPATRAA